MTPPRPSRRRARAPLVILLVGLLLASPLAAAGAWSSQATLATVSGSVGQVEPPANVTCNDVPGGLLQTAARVSWQPPAGHSDVEYRVQVDDGTTIAAFGTDETATTLDRDLLTNLLVGLLEFLLGGGTAEVSIMSVHTSGWSSTETDPVTVTGGLLGVYCV